MKIHKSITVDRLVEAAERTMFDLSMEGICIACGESQEGCEPDARNYECESCSENKVFGVEELLLRMVP